MPSTAVTSPAPSSSTTHSPANTNRTASSSTSPTVTRASAATGNTASHHPKKTRSTKPKLFQCTGFGDCHMVFTRSEHLARHTRKHTGEKPYLCIVPGCTRRFSRFDNMMQHTQTHKATRSKRSQAINYDESNSSCGSHKMAVHQLCAKPQQPPLKELHLTQAEFEALQGFGRFKHTPVFIDSFRDLASVVYIEPNPVRP
ncbi:hypothetical protein BDF20DRAFT_820337 [Mycotypha africana]|uniref:uncharacterized protein n=1 Tax=Mycotypha africana TaxID=64632 RepID=UPI00230057EE|nr:uncharacterized protein BDF20DRAFT_820337 [Mycotypha africana]KAI8979318.1 hypothetical protein BDF20DRAFT_820337 [Mycotypha africana]